jgi:hypothetical protein
MVAVRISDPPKGDPVMSGKIRTTALVLILAGLLAPAAYALPRGAAFPVTHRDGLTAVLWSWLSRVTAIWEKEGSSMDPNGQPQSDAGSQMDPNGQPKEGSQMDPDGKPQSVPPPSSTTDAGGDMDPNG